MQKVHNYNSEVKEVMQDSQTWRELLGKFLQDPRERSWIAAELGVNPLTFRATAVFLDLFAASHRYAERGGKESASDDRDASRRFHCHLVLPLGMG